MALRSACVMALLVTASIAGAQSPSSTQFPVTQLPYRSIQEFLNGDPRLSLLLQLAIPSYATLNQANLRATIFLPTSDAVLSYLYEQWGMSDVVEAWSDPNLNARLLGEFNARVLPYHLVPEQPLQAGALRDGMQLASLLGPPLTMARTGASISVRGPTNSATLVAPNQLINNGSIVCHLISAVLLPPPAPATPSPPASAPPPRRTPPPPAGKPPPPLPPSASIRRPPSPPPPSPAPARLPPWPVWVDRRSPSPPPPRLSPPPPSPPPSPRQRPPPPAASPPPPTPSPRPSPKPGPPPPRPRPRPPSPAPPGLPDSPASRGVDLLSDLRRLPDTAAQLWGLAARGGVGRDTTEEQALQLLSALSPHAAAYLSRNATSVATLFLPSPEALSLFLSPLLEPPAPDLPAQIALFRRALTVTAFHTAPGGNTRRTYRAADLRAAAAAAGSGGAALPSLVPGSSLRVSLAGGGGEVRLADPGGGTASLVQADLGLGQRLVLHVIDAVLLPPPDASIPLAGPRLQARPYPSLQSWLADPANLDATLWHLLAGALPQDGSLLGPPGSGEGLDDPNLLATLFLPESEAFLSSPALLSALSAPPPEGSAALPALLRSCLLPDLAAGRAALQALPPGTALTSAAGSPLVLGALADGNLTVNGVAIRQYDRMAAQVVVHTVADVLPALDWSPPPLQLQPPPPLPRSRPSPPRAVPPPPSPPPPSPPPSPPLAFGSLPEALSSLPELSALSSLYAAASASPLFGIIMGAVLLRPFTMFLPSDEALLRHLSSSSPPAPASLEALAAAVRADARVLVRALSPATLSGRAIAAAALADGARLGTGMAGTPGASLTVRRLDPGDGSPASVQLVQAGGRVAGLLRTDVALTNKQGTGVQGYIHVVDTFIEPA